jgi:lipopolysaccharide export LptBFGC system permease protein LptF
MELKKFNNQLRVIYNNDIYDKINNGNTYETVFIIRNDSSKKYINILQDKDNKSSTVEVLIYDGTDRTVLIDTKFKNDRLYKMQDAINLIDKYIADEGL